MGSTSQHKVCFSIDGRPAINRALDIYKSSGIKHTIVVVGAMAGQVIETIGKEHEGIIYAYQSEQLGTAHATRQAARILDTLGEDEDVLIVAGDRIIEPRVLEQFFDIFYSQHADLALLTGPKPGESSSFGHVLLSPGGDVLGNIETYDLWQRHIFSVIRNTIVKGLPLSRHKIHRLITDHFSEKKASLAFGDLWQAIEVEKRAPSAEEILNWIPPEKTVFKFIAQDGDPLMMTPFQVKKSSIANKSVYLIKNALLQYALERIDRDNAQKEEYLSDIITIAAQARHQGKPLFKVRTLWVENPHDVMGFNNPAELLDIESYIQSKKKLRVERTIPPSLAFRKISEWQKIFQELAQGKLVDNDIIEELTSLYNTDPDLLQERIQAYLITLDYAASLINPDENVFLIHSPGRVNLMGRHIDHQGGSCNLMTIRRENLAVVHPRQDDHIHLYNLNRKQFPERQFSIGELVRELPWEDWISLVNSEEVSRMVLNTHGDWAQYVKAAVLRLQKNFSDLKLCGMDMVVNGNIPLAAGLSSSSSLVVSTAEAMVAVNQLDTSPSQFVDLCGEGEWFVGTRGGSADHAAIKLGQKDHIVKVGFFDFKVEDFVPFPVGYVLAVFDSGIAAQKTTNARNQFNQRVACYRIGFMLIKKLFPQYTSLLHHLRDINAHTLSIPQSWIYKMLIRLPEQITRKDIETMLPDEDLGAIFSSHHPPADGLYPIRGVLLYGLAECERGRIFADLLKSNHIEEIGRLMNVSHNGDRVAQFDASERQTPYHSPTSNAYLLDLIEHLESGDPTRTTGAQLQWQAGSYRCSLPEIDHMVDISLRTPGVIGAQLAGAGLGGCMMVLLHKNHAQDLSDHLTHQYYQMHNLPPSIMFCQPIAGSGVLFMDKTNGIREKR